MKSHEPAVIDLAGQKLAPSYYIMATAFLSFAALVGLNAREETPQIVQQEAT